VKSWFLVEKVRILRIAITIIFCRKLDWGCGGIHRSSLCTLHLLIFQEDLNKISWDAVFVDEVHTIKVKQNLCTIVRKIYIIIKLDILYELG